MKTLHKIMLPFAIALVVVDISLLCAFWRFSNQVERFTGKNCFDLARLSAFLKPFGFVIIIVLLLKSNIPFIIIALAVLMTLWQIWQSHHEVKYIKVIQEKYEELNQSGNFGINPLAFLAIKDRVFFLINFVFMLYLGIPFTFLLTPLMYIFSGYFIACTPLPPGSKKTESSWIDEFKKKQLAFEGN